MVYSFFWGENKYSGNVFGICPITVFRANFEHKDTNLCVKPPPSFFVNNSTGERLQAELTPTWLPSLTPEDTGQAPLSKYQKLN